MYFTDLGIEELGERRGEEQVTLGWLPAAPRREQGTGTGRGGVAPGRSG